MKLTIDVKESLSIVKSNVEFSASFFAQKDKFADAFDAVFKDTKKVTEALLKLGVPMEAITVRPVMASVNWVRTEKESTSKDGKAKEFEYVQKGFVANGYVTIKLPLSWADDNNKFSSLYAIIDKAKTKKSIQYDFYADTLDIENAKMTLRGKLINSARTKLNEIMVNEKEKTFHLVNLVYEKENNNIAYRKASCRAASTSLEVNSIEEQLPFDADTLDNIISLDFAPNIEITDSALTVWETTKKHKKK